MKNQLTQKWLNERNMEEHDLVWLLENSNPDCDDAKNICDFAKHAIGIINGLEQELLIYQKHAEKCNVKGY